MTGMQPDARIPGVGRWPRVRKRCEVARLSHERRRTLSRGLVGLPLHLAGLEALFAFGKGVFDLFPVTEGLESLSRDLAVVDEDVLAVGAVDEAEALLRVEPLDLSTLLRVHSDVLSSSVRDAGLRGERVWIPETVVRRQRRSRMIQM